MLSVQYYSSCNIPTYWNNKPLIPAVNILSVSGFDFDAYKFEFGSEKIFLTGECTLFYILTKHIPLIESHVFGPWRCTRTVVVGQGFNDQVDLLLPYKSLHDYHGICFVLTLGCIDEKCKYDRPVALTHIPLYNSKKIFRRGMYELEMHLIKDLDVCTLDDIPSLLLPEAFTGKTKRFQELNFLLKMNRRVFRGELPESSLAKVAQSAVAKRIHELMSNTKGIFLSVEFLFSLHQLCTLPIIHTRQTYQLTSHEKKEKRNPVDEKYVKISRNPRTADIDRNRKPNNETLEKLKILLMYPPHRDLSDTENDLIWKYRFYLSKMFPEESLSKFVLAVKWEYPEQEKQALELLGSWPRIPPEVVLELLTGRFKFRAVRNFAVRRLEEASDEVLLLYLYQLVQALRYEGLSILNNMNSESGELHSHNVNYSITKHPQLAKTVEEGNAQGEEYSSVQSTQDSHSSTESSGDVDAEIISVEEDANGAHERDSTAGNGERKTEIQKIHSKNIVLPPQNVNNRRSTISVTTGNDSEDNHYTQSSGEFYNKDLATFLIERSLRNKKLANYLFWYLNVELRSPGTGSAYKIYKHIFERFSSALKRSLNTYSWRADLKRQSDFINTLTDLMNSLSSSGSNRKKKEDNLRQKLASNSYPEVTSIMNAFSLPINPDFNVVKVEPESAKIFKSGKEPVLLTLISKNKDSFKVIFKYGDDLRQDQLALQMIQLMNSILLKDNCDLQLTPYRVLATTDSSGFVEFIESKSISDVMSNHRSILAYLQEVAPNKNHPLGVNKDVMNNYIRSCAGYCVITYLLGVGDRHTENLMITNQGQFFHIDFGFILGNDPKPMPAEIRLTKPMIEAMGGFNTPEFMEFSSLTFSVYRTLRRHANLFLTMFALVLDAGIKDVSREPNKVFDFLTDRFCLGLTDEQAVAHLHKKMTDSVNAFFPEFMERCHAFMQLLRA